MPHDSSALRFTVGTPMALAGLVFMLLGLTFTGGLVFVATRPGPDMSLVVRAGLIALGAFPLLVATVGFWISFAGYRLTLDPDKREVRVVHGLWYPWKREQFPLSAFDTIQLTREAGRASAHDEGGHAPSHAVRLVGPEHTLELFARGALQTARKQAEQVCQQLQLPLHDATDGAPLVRAPEELDESLAMRARRLGETSRWPGNTSRSRIVTATQPGEARLLLPRPDAQLLREGVIGLVFLLLVYGGAMYALGRFGQSALQAWELEAWTPLLWGLALLPLVYLLLFGLILLLAREQLQITHGSLCRTWQIGPMHYRRTLQSAAIEELRRDGNELLLRTDDETVRVGFALRKEEATWLEQALRHLLIHGPGAAR